MSSRRRARDCIATERTLLRPWRESDREPFARINADPDVMRHFPSTLSRKASDDLFDLLESARQERGFGIWAIELPGVAPLVGFVGLHEATFEAKFTPCIEIGWRLDAPYWGRGLAFEASRAALAEGFAALGVDEILAWTAAGNVRSRVLMDRLGMVRDEAKDFDHPRIPAGDPLRAHVLYRLSSEAFSLSHP